MAVKSLIEWCDATVNPAYGCFKCSPACEHCYAERMAARFSHNPSVAHLFAGTVDASGHWTGKVNLWPERMEQVLHWRKPRRIFVGSMTDLFHPNVPFEFLDRVFAVMALCPQHTFQALTKRPERMREYMERIGQPGRLQDAILTHGGNKEWDKDNAPQWPLPNVWMGTTIWDQASADHAVPILLSTPAAKRFVSVEPMLTSIDISPYLDYCTTKGEMGDEQRRDTLRTGEIRRMEDNQGGGDLDAEREEGRTSNASWVSPGQENDQRSAPTYRGTPFGVSSLQRCDTRPLNDQSSEWSEGRQSTGKSGDSNIFGEHETCVCDRACESRRRAESVQQADEPTGRRYQESICAGRDNPGEAGCRVHGNISDDIKDCESGKTANAGWNNSRIFTSSQQASGQKRERSIHQIIVGGETGPGARPMQPDWVRNLRDQCEAAGVPFFFKSWGEWAPCRLQHIDNAVNRTNGRYHWEFDPECKGDMRRLGKKAAGRVLDGRTWEQFPEVGS